jgi:hypothetical protein
MPIALNKAHWKKQMFNSLIKWVITHVDQQKQTKDIHPSINNPKPHNIKDIKYI